MKFANGSGKGFASFATIANFATVAIIFSRILRAHNNILKKAHVQSYAYAIPLRDLRRARRFAYPYYRGSNFLA